MGGCFRLMGKLLSRLPYQMEEPAQGRMKRFMFKVTFVLLKEIFHYWIPYLLVHVDFLDRKKDFNLGYLCHAAKPISAS
jgi:hypothetical protein